MTFCITCPRFYKEMYLKSLIAGVGIAVIVRGDQKVDLWSPDLLSGVVDNVMFVGHCKGIRMSMHTASPP